MLINEYLKKVLQDVSIDCIIFGFDTKNLKVLLLKWKNTDKWSLPGGRIFKEESLTNAMHRIVEERTGLTDVFLQQFQTFGSMDRFHHFNRQETCEVVEKALGEKFDPNALEQRTLSVGYYALVNISEVHPQIDAYTDEWHWWDIKEVPKLLFDHNEMITTALARLRKEIRFQPIGNLLPEKFTLTELRTLFESILNQELDRRNFHKLMSGYEFLTKLDEKREGTAHRAPHLYQFDFNKYQEALEKGI